VSAQVSAPVRSALHHYIAAPSTISSLRAYVRRRGIGGDVDDVVQTVLCDALASSSVPADPVEIPRWVTGIAKRKVVDEHRRRARFHAAEPAEQSSAMQPEVRDLLRRIDTELSAPGERRVLGCLLREHAGDSLLEIARQDALTPDTLRQRICRLRRQLRARYLAALVLLLAMGGAGAGVAVRDTTAPAATVQDRSLASYAGTWRVADASPEQYARLGLVVVIATDGIRVQGPAGFVWVEQAPHDVLILRSGGATWHATLETHGGDRLTLTTDRGFVVLTREH
jgi:DNA-directed RNA polymerase specialized sigma24 family protein